jgi:hypothetical protein
MKHEDSFCKTLEDELLNPIDPIKKYLFYNWRRKIEITRLAIHAVSDQMKGK